MTRRPVPLLEGGQVPLADLLPPDADASDREAFRTTVHRTGARQREELGLRQDAFTVEETEDGPVLRTRGVSGTVTLGRRTFDIRPKHVEDPADPHWQRVLLSMVERAAGRRASFSRSTRLQLAQGTFIDQLAMGLALELEEATRHPEVRAYRTAREELNQLRGRLLIAEQLRSSLTKPHKLICEVDELSADNPVNRLLHWAAEQLGALAVQPSVRHALSVAAGRLPAVTRPVSSPTRLSFPLPRQYQHYSGAVQLAIAFARGRTTTSGASDVGGAGFLVGTERLFESFLERSLLAAMSGEARWTVTAQDRSVFALPQSGQPQKYFSKPDNVVRYDDQVRLLVDAKYKKFRDADEANAGDKPSNADLYQMAAACLAHQSERALLVYPRVAGDDLAAEWSPVWWRIDGTDKYVGAVAAPLEVLAAPSGLREFDERLHAVVEQAALAPIATLKAVS